MKMLMDHMCARFAKFMGIALNFVGIVNNVREIFAVYANRKWLSFSAQTITSYFGVKLQLEITKMKSNMYAMDAKFKQTAMKGEIGARFVSSIYA
jgi:hypothetical protein